MAGVTQGVGGFAGPDAGVPVGALTDLSIFSTDHTAIMDNFGFIQFVQIFFLGDTRLLMSTSPRVTVGQFGQDEDILNNTRNAHALLGDPVKNTMMLQSLRRLPILTAIPILVTLALVVVDVIMLINPIAFRIIEATPLAPVVAPFTGGSGRRKRSIDGAEHGKGSKKRLTHSIASLTKTVYWALEKKGWLESEPAGSVPGTKLSEEDEQVWVEQGEQLGGIGESPADEDRQGNAWKEGLPEYNVAPYTKIEVVVRETIGSFADILPQMGSCIGTLIGCHFRLAFWGDACQPFGFVITCSGMVGRSISHLLGVLGRNEIIYPI